MGQDLKGLVVAVALVDEAGRVLAARRVSPPALAGLWEFPGGKVEPGEDELTALRRECREELAVEIEVGRLFGEIALPAPGWRMRLWLGRVLQGTPVATAHDALRWLGAQELDDVPWLPADGPLVDALRGELTGASAQAVGNQAGPV
ncbi:NUDIX hydrolase [Frankia sp. CcI49]|uniref:8-oxo-dGTP diphosphatase n=1 Tax=Parafrankia irregularis TaxID=795642 RepID=A0A0S4QU55_9ACTN|nr:MULTISPECIES: (deoxy)nucleoside triphosphate pyrophosphohydrolase [Frankiaceae]KPM57443.1 NUDIX hydrolase [Frankia sp. R43]MBE3205118.1 (deoxy)nucleoside triphosphate pyrophosphohydrolase [Parafrankia sp. CH37]ONH57916.1 NUDIX hydrolase [Frankia sp. CcI49]CUU58655.1 8-oxo-dGTP diphosphatase [Parafrankia irregularis]